MHGHRQAWFAEVVPLEKVEPHAIGMSDFLAFAASLRFKTGPQAEIAFDKLHALCVTSIREIGAYSCPDGRTGLHDLTWRAVGIVNNLRINTDIQTLSPSVLGS